MIGGKEYTSSAKKTERAEIATGTAEIAQRAITGTNKITVRTTEEAAITGTNPYS